MTSWKFYINKLSYQHIVCEWLHVRSVIEERGERREERKVERVREEMERGGKGQIRPGF